MGHEDVLEKKKKLRKKVRGLRENISAVERLIFSSRITAELSRQFFFQDSSLIMAYASMLEEVQLYDLLRFSLDTGKRICIPYIDEDGSMEAVELHGMEELVEGRHGILTVQDAEKHLVDAASIGCIIVPGVAFSTKGTRLGMGKGYYDRFLTQRSPYAYRVALAFDCQIEEDIPAEPHDVAVDYIITEKRTICCSKNR